MDAVRLALIAAAAAWTLAGGTLAPAALIGVTASAAALVAARERRHRDMALAAGIAAGASPLGLALLPVLLGATIARRTAGSAAALFTAACLATIAVVGWTPATDVSLPALLPAGGGAPPLAAACGVAAWIAASCASRSPSADELDAAALLACIALPLLAPLGAEAAGLAAALAIGGVTLSLRPVGRAANDDPLPLRAVLSRHVPG